MQDDFGDDPPHVDIRPTNLGQGVFALRSFEPDEVVGVVTGEVIDDPDYGSHYSMDLGGDLTLEPGPPFRFLNHCCQPNCALVTLEYDDGSAEMVVEVLASIHAGDELSIDYGWPAECAIECRCESPNCRGWIVDKDELGAVLGARAV